MEVSNVESVSRCGGAGRGRYVHRHDGGVVTRAAGAPLRRWIGWAGRMTGRASPR